MHKKFSSDLCNNWRETPPPPPTDPADTPPSHAPHPEQGFLILSNIHVKFNKYWNKTSSVNIRRSPRHHRPAYSLRQNLYKSSKKPQNNAIPWNPSFFSSELVKGLTVSNFKALTEKIISLIKNMSKSFWSIIHTLNELRYPSSNLTEIFIQRISQPHLKTTDGGSGAGNNNTPSALRRR